MSTTGSDRPDDPDVAGMAGLYALDALEGDDLVRFEEYLSSSPATQDEVAGFRETAARLATATSEPAPHALRPEVLGRLRSVRQEPVRLDVARADRRRAVTRRVAALAAAVVLIAGVGFGGYTIGSSSDELPNQLTSTAEQLADVIARDDAAILQFEGDVSARLVYTSSGGRAVVIADGMSAPPEGYVYELWQVRGDDAVSAGLFTPDEDGLVREAADVDLAPGDVVAVTVEPAGGSDAPTTPMILNATI